jgi:hypothetical protein
VKHLLHVTGILLLCFIICFDSIDALGKDISHFLPRVILAFALNDVACVYFPELSYEGTAKFTNYIIGQGWHVTPFQVLPLGYVPANLGIINHLPKVTASCKINIPLSTLAKI